jgi:hypothetical protein
VHFKIFVHGIRPVVKKKNLETFIGPSIRLPLIFVERLSGQINPLFRSWDIEIVWIGDRTHEGGTTVEVIWTGRRTATKTAGICPTVNQVSWTLLEFFGTSHNVLHVVNSILLCD